MKCWQPTIATQSVAAPELLNDIYVNVKKCACSINRQTCTVACTCKVAVSTEADNDISMCTNVQTHYSVMSTKDNDSVGFKLNYE